MNYKSGKNARGQRGQRGQRLQPVVNTVVLLSPFDAISCPRGFHGDSNVRRTGTVEFQWNQQITAAVPVVPVVPVQKNRICKCSEAIKREVSRGTLAADEVGKNSFGKGGIRGRFFA